MFAGQCADGDIYTVRLTTGNGTVYVSDRAIAAFGDRITPAFIARRLNTFTERVGAAEASGCLRRPGTPIELAPDGAIDEG